MGILKVLRYGSKNIQKGNERTDYLTEKNFLTTS